VNKRMLAGIVVAAMVAVAAPAASAGPVIPIVTIQTAHFTSDQLGGDAVTGGCFLAAVKGGLLTSGSFSGVLGDASVTRGANGLPVAATVSCKVVVNGVTVVGPTAFGGAAGVEAGVNQIAYTAFKGDLVALCESVDGSAFTCQAVAEINAPPPVVTDLVDTVSGIVDPIVCPILVSLAGNYAVVVIRTDGDIDLVIPSVRLYDCPPY